jgi:hypothetical protein
VCPPLPTVKVSRHPVDAVSRRVRINHALATCIPLDSLLLLRDRVRNARGLRARSFRSCAVLCEAWSPQCTQPFCSGCLTGWLESKGGTRKKMSCPACRYGGGLDTSVIRALPCDTHTTSNTRTTLVPCQHLLHVMSSLSFLLAFRQARRPRSDATRPHPATASHIQEIAAPPASPLEGKPFFVWYVRSSLVFIVWSACALPVLYLACRYRHDARAQAIADVRVMPCVNLCGEDVVWGERALHSDYCKGVTVACPFRHCTFEGERPTFCTACNAPPPSSPPSPPLPLPPPSRRCPVVHMLDAHCEIIVY